MKTPSLTRMAAFTLTVVLCPVAQPADPILVADS